MSPCCHINITAVTALSRAVAPGRAYDGIMRSWQTLADTRDLEPYDTVFFVARAGDGWQVRRADRPIGHFPELRLAIRWAALSAQAAELSGERATFRILDQAVVPVLRLGQA
ncbi:MAG: hypothetical protein D6782_09960, partial [Alphaproteobacteria bacterium]